MRNTQKKWKCATIAATSVFGMAALLIGGFSGISYAAPTMIRIDCTGAVSPEVTVGVDNVAGVAFGVGTTGCSLTPTSFTPGSDLTIRLLGSPSGRIILSIVDASGDQKYTVSGDVSSDKVQYYDSAGSDTPSFSGGSNDDEFFVVDTNSNDAYKYQGGSGSDTFTIAGFQEVDPADGDRLSISP